MIKEINCLLQSLVRDCFLVQRFGILDERDGAAGRSWLHLHELTGAPLTSYVHKVQSHLFVVGYCLVDKESWRQRETFIWIPALMDCMQGGPYQMGPRYCFCRLTGGVGNLTAQPWIGMAKGSVIRAWLALKRLWIKQPFNWFSLLLSRWHSQSL